MSKIEFLNKQGSDRNQSYRDRKSVRTEETDSMYACKASSVFPEVAIPIDPANVDRVSKVIMEVLGRGGGIL